MIYVCIMMYMCIMMYRTTERETTETQRQNDIPLTIFCASRFRAINVQLYNVNFYDQCTMEKKNER